MTAMLYRERPDQRCIWWQLWNVRWHHHHLRIPVAGISVPCSFAEAPSSGLQDGQYWRLRGEVERRGGENIWSVLLPCCGNRLLWRLWQGNWLFHDVYQWTSRLVPGWVTARLGFVKDSANATLALSVPLLGGYFTVILNNVNEQWSKLI